MSGYLGTVLLNTHYDHTTTRYYLLLYPNKIDSVGFALRRLVISTVYYNKIIYLVYGKKKNEEKLLSDRATYYTPSGTLCRRRRPDNTPAAATATACPSALLSYIRGYFTAVTKGCIFGFD